MECFGRNRMKMGRGGLLVQRVKADLSFKKIRICGFGSDESAGLMFFYLHVVGYVDRV